ncbi:hypothetical protein D3093_34945 (plasmid) [Azospirillum argentinense]|uniref:Uncharacterized protein n=1 Tax=Azospirillum argentinense TaxID=2970906 RepID=A0A4D8PSZ0_9PROT|nr:YgjV family protein [Azospirillum argentinense]QCO00451.1 hypothetical protein D3093_34945 [Azospirillum argentinense]
MTLPHLSDLAGAAGFILVALWPWLSVLQVATAWPDDRPSWCRALYAATVPLLAVLTASTWVGWPSACAAAGMALGTAARWCRSALLLRVLFLLAGACWVVHDILTGSTFGLLADLLCMAGLVLRRDARLRTSEA